MARCTVTICHSATRDLPALVRQADIVVAAVGKARMVQGDWIKRGAIVLDVGMNRLPDGKLTGDVDFEAARVRPAWITPVPGNGAWNVAMPMLKVTGQPPRSHNPASAARSLSIVACSASPSVSGNRRANSSPPTRPTTSLART